jgi:hypothetical protein
MTEKTVPPDFSPHKSALSPNLGVMSVLPKSVLRNPKIPCGLDRGDASTAQRRVSQIQDFKTQFRKRNFELAKKK